MFYVKTELAEGATITTEITEENVFTICPECGQAFSVNLGGILATGEVDLCSTRICCPKCSDIIRGEGF